MRLEKYTLDVRECRAKRGARRERTNITKDDRNACVSCRERSAQNPSSVGAILPHRQLPPRGKPVLPVLFTDSKCNAFL